MDRNVQKLPVFVFPHELNFFLLSKESHKQLLALYNPYDYPVKYIVLSTARSKYSVKDFEGTIDPQRMVDILIRHLMPVQANCGVVDKFKIKLFDSATNQVVGSKEVLSRLLPGEPDIASSGDDFEKFQSFSIGAQGGIKQTRSVPTGQKGQTSYIVIIVGAICATALLFFPTYFEKETESIFPIYLHLSVNMKIAFSFILGLITSTILRL